MTRILDNMEREEKTLDRKEISETLDNIGIKCTSVYHKLEGKLF